VAENYSQSSAGEIKLEKIEQAFSELKGFKQQKEEVKSFLLLEKYQKAKGTEFRQKGKILC
jgi:hypothetical protein